MIKRITALVLCAALSVLCLASCGLIGSDLDAATVVAAAEGKLGSEIYTADVTVTMSAKDPALQERIDSLGETSISVSSDGEGFKMRTEVALDDVSVLTGYVAAGGILYRETVATVGDKSATEKVRAELDGVEIAEVISKLGAGAEIGYEDFDEVKIKGSAQKCTITCEGLKEDATSGAEMTLASSLGDGMDLTLTEAAYTAKIEDGLFKSVTVVYTFSVSLEGVAYSMTSEIVTDYSYGNTVIISAPADADEYELVTYEQIVK